MGRSSGISLQVLTVDERWVDVPPIPDSFVVNLGDLMQRWTNDRYLSRPHRVVGVPGRHRYSMACFFDLDHDATIECLPTCTDATNPPRYAPITAGAHVMERYAASIER